jgi:hypothetical protein
VDAPTADEGLHVGGVTNFEFEAAPTTPEPGYTFAYGDSLASYVVSWNQTEPLSGTADLRFDFGFQEQPAQYDEWVGMGLLTSAPEVSVTPYSELVFTFATDTARTVRVRLLTPAYDDTWGGIGSEFGVNLAGSASARTVVVPLDSFVYPPWAKDAWTAGQGFLDEAAALKLALERFNGLVFGPAATLDATGELVSEVERGFLQVDNLYFR